MRPRNPGRYSIHWHVTCWVALSDRGFAAGEEGEALITTIQIKEIEREVG